MIENGAGYGVALVLQHLLRKLEAKGILAHSETLQILDAANDEIKQTASSGALSLDAATSASRTIETMHSPLDARSEGESRGAIDIGALNASNDE